VRGIADCVDGREAVERRLSVGLPEPDPDGGYFVTVPALPGCFTRGSTVEECRVRAVEATEARIAGLQSDGQPVPEEVGEAHLLAVTVAA